MGALERSITTSRWTMSGEGSNVSVGARPASVRPRNSRATFASITEACATVVTTVGVVVSGRESKVVRARLQTAPGVAAAASKLGARVSVPVNEESSTPNCPSPQA